ncbi:hypothetical protein [Aquimarina longa]|uniref:hypothetical protein n=1 Tax=Aquimarina longa TaxID=1080221 RepID=UPI000780605A|nr:hypothetical protein [Aquimarina longa]
MRTKRIKINSILFILLLISTGISNLNAQENTTKKNEIRVSVSDAIPLTFSNAFASSIISGFDIAIGGKGYELNNATYGMLHLNYQRRLSDKTKIGVDFSYTNFDYKNKNNKSDSYKIHYLAIAPQFEYSYIRKNFFELYGNVSAGLNRSFSKVDKKSISNYGFAFQVNPIGIRVGKKLGGFLEGGFGYNGFVNLGVSYKF